MTERVVQAAGGVVWRPAAGQADRTATATQPATAGAEYETDVALVHRPRYDDWTLPKGKLDPGEHPLLGAVREVYEETGAQAVPQVRLPSTMYLTGVPGVTNAVQYWSMRPAAIRPFTPNDEIDELRWLPTAEAAALATYRHDRGVLAAFAALPPVTGLLLAVRPGGTGDVAGLARLLSVFRPDRVVSAPSPACLATARVLASVLALDAGTGNPLAEPTGTSGRAQAAGERSALRVLRDMTARGGTTVVCVPDAVLSQAITEPNGSADSRRFSPADAAGWILALGGAGLVGVDPIDPDAGPARRC